jgi:nucleoside-diphosphate-sugar epimerase
MQIRDTNYVDDVVDALLVAMITPETNGEVYNIGGEPLTLLGFVEELIRVNGSGKYELVTFPGELKNIEVGDYIASHEKFSQHTGWQPKVPLRDGLTLTLDYYRRYSHNNW